MAFVGCVCTSSDFLWFPASPCLTFALCLKVLCWHYRKLNTQLTQHFHRCAYLRPLNTKVFDSSVFRKSPNTKMLGYKRTVDCVKIHTWNTVQKWKWVDVIIWTKVTREWLLCASSCRKFYLLFSEGPWRSFWGFSNFLPHLNAGYMRYVHLVTVCRHVNNFCLYACVLCFNSIF